MCTNLYNVKMLQEERFTYFSASSDTIKRYEKQKQGREQIRKQISSSEKNEQNVEKDYFLEKNQNIKEMDKIILIMTILEIIILLIVFL